MAETVQTIEDFLRVVRKSGLVEDARLEEAVAGWPDRGAALPEELLQSLIDTDVLTRWQIDQLRKGRHKGFMLGKYKLLRLLGAGGMSSVYLGEHATLHSRAAIKVLPVKRVDQTSYLARFEREAQQSARLSHPNIVRTFDLDTSGTIHFIAMEYIDGVDLHAKVKESGPLEIREAVDYIRQAALGLHHAHEEGLVHRDVKPANLMLDKRGTVKLLDLGLALATAGDEESLTREHDEKVLGTADYLAPEQAADSHKADRRADIYALGCTLYYLLVGKPPFSSGTLAERIQAHMRKPPPNLLDQRADIPPPLAEIYFRMLEKHPDARPQTAQEVADALAAWLATSATGAVTARPQPPRRAAPRRTTPGGSGSHATPPPRRATPEGSASGVPAAGPLGLQPAQQPAPRPLSELVPPPPPQQFAIPSPPGQPGAASSPGSFGHFGGFSPPAVDEPAAEAGFQFNASPKPGTTGATAAAKPAGRPLPKRGMPVIAGLPLGLWLAATGGIVLAIVLGVFVWQKFGGKPSKSRATDDAAETSTDEPAAETKPKKERKPLRSAKPAATGAGN
jgi:serine/threonine protein kinase